MLIITGLRFVDRSIPLPEHGPDLTKTVKLLQMQVTKIWFEVENGVLVMKDMPGEWQDVPMVDLHGG